MNFLYLRKSVFHITDIWTDISAHLSMIAAVISFSLFTAYQFLSSNGRFDAPENKMRPSPSCVCRRVSALMMEMIATRFFLCLLRIKFWVQVLFQNGLDNRLKKSYNTTPAEKGMEYDSLLRPHSLTMWFDPWLTTSLSMFFIDRPHAVIGVFLICSLYFSSLPADTFSSVFYTSKQWPHIIFSDMDLTTFLTIVTSGVHGDKMSGEYEKAVFA